MIVEVKKKLDHNSDLLIKDITPSVESGIYENEFIKISGSRADVIDLGGGAQIECALSSYIASILKKKVLSANKSKVKFKDYQDKLADLDSKIEKLGSQKAIGCFIATSYLEINDDDILIGYNGSRLLLVADVKQRVYKDGRLIFNPFDIPFESSAINDPVNLPIFVFDRLVKTLPSTQVCNHICSRPIQFNALASFISAFSYANTKMDLDTAINGSIALYSKIEKLKDTNYFKFNDDSITEEDIEFVPRSFEHLMKYGGYEGNMPFIDAPVATETITLGGSSTIRDVTAIEYIVRYLRNDLTPNVVLLPSYSKLYVGSQAGGLRALSTLRSYTRVLIGLYKSKNIKTSLDVDLADCVDDIAKANSVNL